MTANLFDDRKPTVNGKTRKPRQGGTLQGKLVQYVRSKGSITEAEYREHIGGKSVSAALHNAKSAGMFIQGVEFISAAREYDTSGGYQIRYTLRAVAPKESAKPEDVAPEPVAEPVPEVIPEPSPEPITREPEPNFIQLVSVDLIGGDCHIRVVMADGGVLTKLLTPMERRFIKAGLSAFD